MTNHEAAILRLEREVSQLAGRIGALERARTPAAEQAALAQWYDPASTRGAATVPFGGCTAVPTVLTAHDSKYGPFPLTYDPASGTFVGCKVVAFPGAGRCPALAAIAIRHVLVDRGTLQTSWKSAGGTGGCPVASACADPLDASFRWSAGASSCAPFRAQFAPSYAEGGHTFLGYGADDGVTITP
ncbi:MAG: hypothetical protein JO284_06270 [Planctomycetaceae bacterium]|nr:hypothetical protein [Planctomycetaceae bacterium]MBV8610892.1 hypothetical protein [Singulisphaera sp.]MBV8233531.1 hypothetical protein [Planctomycetaceae bacterium]MBV8269808.1 hypothetical protein [Planctomycetaceae bacterium]MBV8318245.1 hypothetical protein [Planctomycetaceae bacterium]